MANFLKGATVALRDYAKISDIAHDRPTDILAAQINSLLKSLLHGIHKCWLFLFEYLFFLHKEGPASNN